jgi:hypothetical protein
MAILRGLSRDIRTNGGPVGLRGLATTAGVLALGECPQLPLAAGADELQEALDRYRLPPDGVGRGPIADCEIQVVRREWNRISRSGCSPRSLEDLVLEWCVERLRGLFFSPVESRMEESDAAERLAKLESMENVVHTLLKTEQSGIVQALVRDPSGSRVRQPRATRKASTADLLLEPIPLPREAAR